MQIVDCYDRWLEITHPTILSLNTTWPHGDSTTTKLLSSVPGRDHWLKISRSVNLPGKFWQGVTWPWHHHDISIPKTSQSQNPWRKCCWGVAWGLHWFWINYNTCKPALSQPWQREHWPPKTSLNSHGCTGSDPKDPQISMVPRYRNFGE